MSDMSAVDLLKTAMLDPVGLQDPYPLLRRLHDHGEEVVMPDGVVVVFGHDRVMEMMRSPAFIKDTQSIPNPAFTQTTPEQQAALERAIAEETPFLTFINAPDHGRIRGLVGRAFQPSHLSALKPVIQHHIDRLLDAIDPREPIDIIASFSGLFAPEIVGELIGLPAEHRQTVAAHTATFMRGIDPGASFDDRLNAIHARRAQADYVRGVIADRRANPRDDFITTLIASNDRDRAISEAELVALIQILYVGGYETTSHMIGNGLVALLHNPDQFAMLRADTGLMRSAVDEMLRFDGPISLTQVVATNEALLEGDRARSGATYLGLLGAANHDPAVFDGPERFDITRAKKPHIAFGGGPHFCLGSGLAKLELEMAFAALLTRFPDMKLADRPLRRIPAFHQRAYEAVWVILKP